MTTSPQLPGVFRDLAPVLDHYGYLALAGFVFLEDFGVPVPGETTLVAAAVYAGAGRLNIALVVIVGIAAAVLGDNVGYAIGRFGGRALALRWGRYLFLTEERLDKAQAFFGRNGGKVVAIARFIEGLRQANGIIAGISEMPWLKFLFFNLLGASLWVGVWSSVGYLAGNHLNAIYHQVVRYEAYFVGLLVIVVVALVVRKRMARRREVAQAKP